MSLTMRIDHYMISTKNGADSFLAFSLAWLGIQQYINFAPFIGYAINVYYISYWVIFVASFLVYLTTLKSRVILRSNINLFFLLVCIIFVVFRTHLGIKGYGALLWPLFLIVTLPKHLLMKAFDYLRLIFAIILIPSLILYPLIIFGIDFSIGTVDPLSPGKGQAGDFFINYLFTYVLNSQLYHIGIFNPFRLSALFGEPGFVGTVSGLILSASNFKRDKLNIVIFLSGILSFSFAFYVIIYVYAALNRRDIFFKMLVPALLLAFLFFQDNAFFEKFFFNRLQIKEGWLAADNRSTYYFDVIFFNFITQSSKISYLLFGNPVLSSAEGSTFTNVYTWKRLVWDFGIIGSVLYVSVFVAYAKHFLRRNIFMFSHFLGFFVVFFGSIYQRPYVLNELYFLIFAGAIVLADCRYRQNKLLIRQNTGQIRRSNLRSGMPSSNITCIRKIPNRL